MTALYVALAAFFVGLLLFLAVWAVCKALSDVDDDDIWDES